MGNRAADEVDTNYVADAGLLRAAAFGHHSGN